MKKRLIALLLAVCTLAAVTAGTAPCAAAVETAPTDTVVGYLTPYVLQAGDTMIGVCDGLGINFYQNADYIARINNISSYYYMLPGKTLWLPVSSVASGTAHYTLLSHTLVFGETLYGLCGSYGIDFYASYQLMAALNKNLNYLIAGQTVLLPVYVSGSATTPGATPAPGATVAPSATPGAGATVAPTVAPTAAPGAGGTTPAGDTVSYYLKKHVLQAGETVMGICADLGLNFYQVSDQIMRINNIASYNYLVAGRTLWIPVTSCPTSGDYYKVMAHTVRAGDAVYNLCLTYGIDFTANSVFIQRLNNRNNLATFYVGQTLYLPVYVKGTTVTATPTPGGATATPAPPPTAAPTLAPGTTATPTPTPGPTQEPGATPGPTPAGDTVSYYLKKHVLQAGETISGICADLGLDFYKVSDQIMKINNIASYNYLVAGTTLWIPVTSCPTSGDYYKVAAHTIAAGDTVYNLCQTYGIDYNTNAAFIQRLNNRNDLTTFYVGQTLYLPVYVKG